MTEIAGADELESDLRLINGFFSVPAIADADYAFINLMRLALGRTERLTREMVLAHAIVHPSNTRTSGDQQ